MFFQWISLVSPGQSYFLLEFPRNSCFLALIIARDQSQVAIKGAKRPRARTAIKFGRGNARDSLRRLQCVINFSYSA